MSGIGILVWGPDEASASTQRHSQNGLLQCVTNIAHKNCCGKLNGRKTSLPSVYHMVPVLMEVPPNGPSHNASKSPCAKWCAHSPGQLNSLVLILGWCGQHMNGQLAHHPHS